MRWADAVVLNSSHLTDFVVQEEKAARERVTYIPNGIVVEPYLHPVSRTAFCKEFGIAPERRVIGSVGRLIPAKAFDVLLTALAGGAFDEVELVLFGEGELRQSLAEQARALGIEHRVRFAGYRRDMPCLYGALDVYVHPARREGMPNALLEAMAARCSIVASSVNGARELIRDGVHGWLVPPDDANALADALDEALTNRAEAARRGRAAQERAAGEFTEQAMVERWERVLQNE
jgi:glycosyltransferase involved in cell wall biosynthesis